MSASEDVPEQVLLRTFLSCIKGNSVKHVKAILDMYETRAISGTEYRVHKDLENGATLDKDVIFGKRIADKWYCGVPRCGAMLAQIFLTDLHLHAYGTMYLTHHYCIESTCFTGRESIFGEQEALNAHLAKERMDSPYSLKAASRVPRQGVLASGLLDHLSMSLKRTQPSESSIERTNTQAIPETHDGFNDPKNMPGTKDRFCEDSDDNETEWDRDMDTWLSLQKSFNASDVYRLEAERVFDKHRDGSSVFLSQPPESGTHLHPMVPPGRYMVEMLTGRTLMTETEARRFIDTYHQYCKRLGTDDVNKVREFLLGPPKILQSIDPGARRLEDTSAPLQTNEENLKDTTQQSQIKKYCPWPKCTVSAKTSFSLIAHFMHQHLKSVWKCHEKECDYCYYSSPERLVRHHILCHIGTSLQCGHRSCDQVLVKPGSYLGRGHYSWSGLQQHFEIIFKQELRGLFNKPSDSSTSGPSKYLNYSNVQEQSVEGLPSLSEYIDQYTNKSSLYLTREHRSYRREKNYQLLQAMQINTSNVQIIGSHYCEGFFYGDQHFPCADNIDLTLETGMIIFIQRLAMFSISQTCDYCVYVLSLISRPLADLPLPFHFGSRGKLEDHGIQRVGRGSTVNDHASFKELCSREHLQISPMAEKYAKFQAFHPQKIFIVDFESARRSVKNLPLILTELTVRDSEGKIIISCKINETGVTNKDFVDRVRALGYDEKSISGINRIRGPPSESIPDNAKTPKEIVRTLVKAGLKPDALWVEYSTSFFDWRCMATLIEQAGESVRSILPSLSGTWTVMPDFARCLPGLSSYKLGAVLKLMNPDHESLQRLHFSDADTTALHELLRNWIYVYGPFRTNEGFS